MAAQAGWYPDPGGGPGLYRYWDGTAWSAATSPHPTGAPPAQPLVGGATGPTSGQPSQPSQPSQQFGGYGGSAYANYQAAQRKKSPVGWWIASAALIVVVIVVAVLAIRSLAAGGGVLPGQPGEQATQDVCPPERSESPQSTAEPPTDGRVHGGPVSYPLLGSPWGAPHYDDRVPFGLDVQTQDVTVEQNYQPGSSWVASVLVGELQAGDGFFTPEQGSQIVVKCILGKFYGDNPVNSDVQVNKAATIDGHDAWIVESHLTFNISGLKTKGELLIVAIVATQDRSGLFYASIPDTVPELVAPARQALRDLKVDG